MTDAVIQVENLDRSFGNHAVLKDISFNVQKGERVALTGANGIGKTCLLKILMTLLLPTRGQVLVNGWSVSKNAQAIRAKTGWMPARDDGFFPRLSGMENLVFFGIHRGLTKKEVLKSFENYHNLKPFSDALLTPFSHCSTGMKQSLCLVRALLGNPTLLLLDEPTRSFDPENTETVHHILLNSKATIFFSTHAQEDIQSLATRKIELREGMIL